MAVVVSLLRGINVGGHNKLGMDVLRDICATLGLEKPVTYIQSGNVVFKTRRRIAGLAPAIEETIGKRAGFRPSVILRTLAEMEEIVARNPFARRNDIDPAKLAVTFLSAELSPEALRALANLDTSPEELRPAKRELFIYFPHGMGRPKVPMTAIEKLARTPATSRNWNTVLRLLEIAKAFAD